MQAVPLEGRAVVVATLRAKLSVATLRATHATTVEQHATNDAAARTYAEKLRALGEEV